MVTVLAGIVGGPADGLAVAAGRKFEWLEVVVLKRSQPTDGAALYELRDGVYDHVGGDAHQCTCGVVYRGSGCPLCASASTARTVVRGA